MKTKSNNKPVDKIVNNFTDHYQKEFDFYNAASALSAQLIDTKLVNKGIRAIVTSRAKSPSRLHDKLKKRAPEKNYKSSEDIYTDIVDLAGIRVALYFNSELDEINQIIEETFDIKETKHFPTEGKSQGYKATHYRCSLKTSALTEQQERYSKANIEIQIASLLMHAWAEVEHDIVYKPLSGKISDEEKNALDELNDIVLKGEEALLRLQQAALSRNSFNDHYDLYTFLVQYINDKYGVQEEQILVGDTQKLYSFLLSNKIDTQRKLNNKIANLNIILDNIFTLSDQIMDHIAGNFKTNKREYLNNGKLQNKNKEESSIGSFLLYWIELEKLLKENDMGTSYKDTFIRLKSLVDTGLLNKEEYERIYKIRSIRNNLVHGIEIPDNNYLEWYTEEIKELIGSIKNKKQEQING